MLVNYTLNRRTAKPRTGNVLDATINNTVTVVTSGGGSGSDVDLSNYVKLNSTDKQVINNPPVLHINNPEPMWTCELHRFSTSFLLIKSKSNSINL